MNRIEFRVTPFGDYPDEPPPCVEPVIDGTPLSRLVGGDHAGLVWTWSSFGAPSRYFLGARTATESRNVGLLGCSCGEFGCDPFSMEVHVGDRTVAWRHRRVGPFTFARDDYDEALARLDRDLAPYLDT